MAESQENKASEYDKETAESQIYQVVRIKQASLTIKWQNHKRIKQASMTRKWQSHKYTKW